jgi:Zn-dependent protease
MLFINELHDHPRFFFAVCITVIVSICIHELSHGIVAIWRGDRTPIETGHMTLNPVVHMGLMSFVLLLVAGIAWGSMPVDPRRLRGRYSPALVALAGPVSNFLLAAIALAIYTTYPPALLDSEPPMQYLLWIFGYVNIALGIFNLLPIPPLDGSRVLANLSNDYARLIVSLRASGGSTVIFLLIFFFAGDYLFPAADNVANWYVHLLRYH